MLVNKCPNCGNIFGGDRPKFCEQCGCELTQTPSQRADTATSQDQSECLTVEQKVVRQTHHPEHSRREEAFLEKLKEVSNDGRLSVGDIQELSHLREELGISIPRAKQLWEKAVESLRPVQRDDFEERPQKGRSRGIALYINTNCFYMEGFSGVVDIKLENLSDNAFDLVKVEVCGDLLGRTAHWNCRLEPCEKVEKRFQVKPAGAGVQIVQFRIGAKQGSSVYAYWAETDLPVFEKTKELRNISIQADKLIDVGSISDNAKNMGNSVKVNIDNLIRQDKIRNANDLMMEYRKLLPDFRMLQLTFDPDISEQLTNSLTVAKTVGKAKRIIEAERGSLTDCATLQIQSKDKPTHILLVAKPSVQIGRSKKNDIVARIIPRSPENDTKSRRISAESHCRIDLTEKGLCVIDIGSINRTLLDEKSVDANGAQITGDTKELELAGVLRMRVRYLAGKYAPSSSAYEEILGESRDEMWETAAKAGFNSITLERLNNLGVDDKNGFEIYCLVYRIATIGSNPHCSISFSDKGLEPQHAAILYLGRRFYLENLSELTDVVVNDIVLSKDELIPLSFGDRVRIARLDMRFLQRLQLFIDIL